MARFKKGDAKPPGSGRKKGQENEITTQLKEIILRTFDEVGGIAYLKMVAMQDPKTFCTLLGKLIPAEIKAELDHKGDTIIMVDTGANNRPPVGIHKSKIIEHESNSQIN